MKKKFKLQGVLELYELRKKIAQREFFEAKAKVQKKLKEIEDLYEKIEESRRQIADLKKLKKEEIEIVKILESFIDGTKIRLKKEKEKVRELMLEEEE
ncbi:MAG: hypothetical protein D6797_02050, partial [Bdellovibrio sp.]